jgi:3,4-dihydroxy 2-butanone 4-phosphate synthase
MARLPEIVTFAERHYFTVLTIEDLVLATEQLLKKSA